MVVKCCDFRWPFREDKAFGWKIAEKGVISSWEAQKHNLWEEFSRLSLWILHPFHIEIQESKVQKSIHVESSRTWSQDDFLKNMVIDDIVVSVFIENHVLTWHHVHLAWVVQRHGDAVVKWSNAMAKPLVPSMFSAATSFSSNASCWDQGNPTWKKDVGMFHQV